MAYGMFNINFNQIIALDRRLRGEEIVPLDTFDEKELPALLNEIDKFQPQLKKLVSEAFPQLSEYDKQLAGHFLQLICLMYHGSTPKYGSSVALKQMLHINYFSDILVANHDLFNGFFNTINAQKSSPFISSLYEQLDSLVSP